MNRSEGPWFPVATHKFVVLSIFTFGIYDFYWAYQNWRRDRAQTGETFSPFWRTFFFVPIHVFPFLRRVRRSAGQAVVRTAWNAELLAAAFIALAVVQLLPFLALMRSMLDCMPEPSPSCLISAVDKGNPALSTASLFASILWCVPLIPPVRTIAALNAAAGNPEGVNDRYTLPCVAAIAFGAFIYLILIAATLLGF
jgi:hypothetical protein